MQDIMVALITYLGTQSGVTDLVGTRIYGGELAADEPDEMPRKIIVLRYAGGPEEFRTARIQQQRIEVFSFGEDYLEAGRVDRAVADALIAIRRTESENTLLHVAGYGGASQFKDSDTGWRYIERIIMIAAGETAA